MDVVFHDDLMRLRTQNGPANMAAVRHMSLNLIRSIDDKASLKVRRKTIAWDDNYLLAALTAANTVTFKRFPWLVAGERENRMSTEFPVRQAPPGGRVRVAGRSHGAVARQ